MRTSHKSTNSQNQGTSATKAIVYVDDAPLRARVSWEFKKLYETYLRHRDELEHHEKNVRPAYLRWLSHTFRARFGEVEKLHEEVLRRSVLLQRMIQLFVSGRRSKSSAFETAQAELAREEERRAKQEAREKTKQEAHDSGADSEDDTGDAPSGHEHEETRHRSRSSQDRGFEEPRTARAAAPPKTSQLKSLYRKLAQALHPDLVGEPSQLSRELWLETQDAYERQDVEHLGLLWAMISMHRNPGSREVTVAELHAATQQIKSRVDDIKREKRKRSKADPSWGFEGKSRDKLESKISRDLDREEVLLNDALESIELEMDEFARSGERHQHSSSRGRGRSRNKQFEFDF